MIYYFINVGEVDGKSCDFKRGGLISRRGFKKMKSNKF